MKSKQPATAEPNERMNQSEHILSLRPQELETHPLFVAQGKKARVIWTGDYFRTLCRRLLNGNREHDFLMCYRDEEGRPKFSKARKAKARKQIEWAWQSICGTDSGRKIGIGFFPTNDRRQSCWGAMDFDAHNQADRDRDRARNWAAKAFALLSTNPRFLLILGTSGASGGWHLFILTEHFFSTEDWARLLREVADNIGAPIQKGILEILPDGRSRGLGFGIRAPGTWNPKDESFGLIAFAPPAPTLVELDSRTGSGDKERTSLSTSSTTREKVTGLTSCKIFRGDKGEWHRRFAIRAPRTRHDCLSKLVGTAFRETTRHFAAENARLQYAESDPTPASSIDEHLADFEQLWSGMERIWRESFSGAERQLFDALTSDHYRDAFRIIRNWSGKLDIDTGNFFIVCEVLAVRLGVSIQTASIIRRKFCSLGILRKTADYIAHKRAAQYEWLLDETREKARAHHQ